MADGLNEHGQVARATEEATAKRPITAGGGLLSGRIGKQRLVSPHANKFLFATSALFCVAIIAVAIAIVVAHNNSSGGPAPAWSTWSPPDSGMQGARDIADHIAPFYRITGTDQLDAVTVMNLANPNTATSGTTPTSQLQVVVKQDATSNTESLLNGTTIAYNLCGLGTNNCGIGNGAPSTNRLLLLRREGLELALYTFRYLKNVDNVVAVLPPGHTTEQSTLSPTPPSDNPKPSSAPLDLALVFVRQELQPWTSQPLDATLSEIPPSVPQLAQWRSTEEASLVDQLTARGLFADQFVHAEDGSYLLVLTPEPPQ